MHEASRKHLSRSDISIGVLSCAKTPSFLRTVGVRQNHVFSAHSSSKQSGEESTKVLLLASCTTRPRRLTPPHVALFAGPTGLEIYERLVADAARVLCPGGRLIVELGFGTHERVRAMLDDRWCEVEIRPDLAGIPRVLAAQARRAVVV
jgi:hypothetical protein